MLRLRAFPGLATFSLFAAVMMACGATASPASEETSPQQPGNSPSTLATAPLELQTPLPLHPAIGTDSAGADSSLPDTPGAAVAGSAQQGSAIQPLAVPTPVSTPVQTPIPHPTTNTPPTPAEQPTTTPIPAAEPVPTPTSTPTSPPTNTPAPTTVPPPSPTATRAARPTATPSRAATPTPVGGQETTPTGPAANTPTPAAPLPPGAESIADAVAPMGSSLMWVAYFDNYSKSWHKFDPTGTFNPEIIFPPLPSDYQFGTLTYVLPENVYLVGISQAVTYRGVQWEEGILQVVWPAP